jgi:hypothetical protein|tara:strand:- start:3371 stop:3637 length:267 start_codon:yes stop_codon:yes gene_type:complete
MRLCFFSKGHPVLVQLPTHAAVTAAEIKTLLLGHDMRFLQDDGYVRNIFIDFEGEYIVVHHEKELDIVCRMVAAYQNNYIRHGLQVLP